METSLLTTGTILRLLVEVPGLEHLTVYNVRYAISKLDIKPIARAGSAPVYSPDQVEQIRAGLIALAARRAARNDFAAPAGTERAC